MLNERKRVARKYNELIYKNRIDVKTVSTKNNGDSNAYFFYPILVDSRDAVADHLKAKGIDTRIAYSLPLYEQPMYRNGKEPSRKMHCPEAEKFASKVINLPIFPSLDDSRIDIVASEVIKAVG